MSVRFLAKPVSLISILQYLLHVDYAQKPGSAGMLRAAWNSSPNSSQKTKMRPLWRAKQRAHSVIQYAHRVQSYKQPEHFFLIYIYDVLKNLHVHTLIKARLIVALNIRTRAFIRCPVRLHANGYDPMHCV